MIKLMRQKSRVLILITALITLVMIVSFGALYFVLPDFYMYTKTKKLEADAKMLADELNQAKSLEECSELIRDFSVASNSNVIPYLDDGSVLIELVSPLVMFSDSVRFNLVLKQNDGDEKVISIQRFTAENAQEADLTGVNEENIEAVGIISDGMTDSQIAIGKSAPILATDDESQRVEYAKRTNQNGENDVFVTRDINRSAAITKDVESEYMDFIEVISVFQPIDEAKSVMLNLMPLLLIVDILIALSAAFIYLKKVEQYEKSKADFMRAASHELKTPIAALNGIIEGMIDNVGVYKDKDRYLLESKNLIDKMTHLVNEVLYASKEATPVFEEVNVSNVIEGALLQHEVIIEEKGLIVEVSTKDDEEYKVKEWENHFTCRADRKIFASAIGNLVSNAVNYTCTGGKILIVITPRSFTIENECENIAEEKLTKLFEPFYTADDSRDRSNGKTGLGLYIVKQSLDAMKMKYRIENTDIGIRFSICY